MRSPSLAALIGPVAARRTLKKGGQKLVDFGGKVSTRISFSLVQHTVFDICLQRHYSLGLRLFSATATQILSAFKKIFLPQLLLVVGDRLWGTGETTANI